MKRVYLDYAAATPLGEEAGRAMENFLKAGLSGNFGNPASVHQEGLSAREMMEESRRGIARILEVHSDEIVFTSGGTEGDNLVISGVYEVARKKINSPHIITSAIEHGAVLETTANLKKRGAKVTLISPDEKNPVSLLGIEKTLNKDTVLVSVALVNSEIGSMAPIRDISRIIARFKKKLGRGKNDYPYLHTDASQAAALLSIAPHNLGVDFLTADAGKFYGPKGVGFIFAGRGRSISPITFGGGQEKGLRPGTPNVGAICGLRAALSSAAPRREKEWRRILKLQNEFIKGLRQIFPEGVINGQSYKRLPSFVNICIKGLDAEFAVMKLSARGVSASAASACRTISGEGSSYVISAIPGGRECAASSLRFSMGRCTKKSDIDRALKILKTIVKI